MDCEPTLNSLIPGVSIRPLRQILDARGDVLHMLRADSPEFRSFGEVYFSFVKSGIVKAWKRHLRMTQHFAVPVGKIRIALFDDRDKSKDPILEEVILGKPDAYALLRIPPNVWYGFQGIAENESLICNLTDLPHDPQEVERCDKLSYNIDFIW